MRLLRFTLFVVCVPLWPVLYVACRLSAKTCPRCGERWFTELTGEWDGEMWECRRCGHYWETPYRA